MNNILNDSYDIYIKAVLRVESSLVLARRVL